jgi:hypothetical protein
MNDEQIDPVLEIHRILDQVQEERRDCVHRHLNKNKLKVKQEVWTTWYADLLIDSGDMHDGKMEKVGHEIYGSLTETGLDCAIGNIRYEKIKSMRPVVTDKFGHGLSAVRIFFNGPTRGVIPHIPAVVNGVFSEVVSG